MTAIAPIPPETFKAILERYGFILVRETEFNWTLFKNDINAPLVIPKEGELVAVDIMMEALHQAKMDNKTYFDLLNKIQN